MDIGNLPIYSNDTKKCDINKPRGSFGDAKEEKKSAWDQIGDYEETPSTNTNVIDDDDDENYEQPKIVSKLKSKDTKKDSDEALFIASQAVVNESKKNQS